jgi:hypothetical protein
MIREDIVQEFPELFGTKSVNGREVNVEQAIAALTRELGPEIAKALTARRALLEPPAPVTRISELSATQMQPIISQSSRSHLVWFVRTI